MAEPRGAGRAGGLLFIAVLLFVGYLLVEAIAGLVQWVLGAALLVVVVLLVVAVLRRR